MVGVLEPRLEAEHIRALPLGSFGVNRISTKEVTEDFAVALCNKTRECGIWTEPVTKVGVCVEPEARWVPERTKVVCELLGELAYGFSVLGSC